MQLSFTYGPTLSARRLLLLREVDALALEDVEQRLAALHDLGVRRLRLLDRLVVLVARRDLARQVVVQPRQPLGQDPQVVLDLGLLLLVGRDRLVDLLALCLLYTSPSPRDA